MGFMGLDFLKESKQAELEDEEDLEIFSTKTLDVMGMSNKYLFCHCRP